LTWERKHLRPANILSLLCFDEHRVGTESQYAGTSDHGAGWGNGMERKFIGEYLPESRSGN
jgi:hypothetical protein